MLCVASMSLILSLWCCINLRSTWFDALYLPSLPSCTVKHKIFQTKNAPTILTVKHYLSKKLSLQLARRGNWNMKRPTRNNSVESYFLSSITICHYAFGHWIQWCIMLYKIPLSFSIHLRSETGENMFHNNNAICVLQVVLWYDYRRVNFMSSLFIKEYGLK